MSNTLLAQQYKSLGELGGPGLGPFGAVIFWIKEALGRKFGDAFSAIVGLLTVVAGLFFIFQFLTGGLQWLGAGGDKAGLEQARQKITNSLIGLVIVVATIAMIKVIGIFLGFNLLDPASFIESIKFK